MSRTFRPAAILISLLAAGMGAPAVAGDPVAAPAANPAMPQAATASERATYDRLDPLSRSVFWSRERQINPADPVPGVKLAQALREMGQYDQAVSAAQQTLVGQPSNVEAMLELGKAHIARGQAFYGIAPLEQARVIAPGDWRALSLLGVAYQQVRRVDDARAIWTEALRLSPDNPEVLTNAAVALTAEGNAPAAETLLRRAVAQPGATLRMRQNLALVLGLQGRTAEAEQIIRRDLPPELAERNLQWLREKTAPGTAQAATVPALTGTARTWDSVQNR